MTRRPLNDRCTSNDYRQLFAGSAERLRWLCYILTGNQELSEKLLDAALEQSLKGSDHVFREWMVSWARRLIIRVCIDTMRPRMVAMAGEAYLLPPMRLDAIDPNRLAEVLSLPTEVFQDRLLEQDVLSRFVFVLRALEGYSRRETSLMLDIDDRSCEWIYVRAAEAMEVEREAMETPLVGCAHYSEYFLAQAGQ
jgi:DNA-directed RNA polymerase specialized sigma24 family protein